MKKKKEFDIVAFAAFLHKNGATWLKEHVPDASPFACKIAEILKVCMGGSLYSYEDKFFRQYSKDQWKNDNYIEVSISSESINGGTDVYNRLFMLIHLCNEMNIICYADGKAFGYIGLSFRRKNIVNQDRYGAMGNTQEHIKMIQSYISSNGGCEIKDMCENKICLEC